MAKGLASFSISNAGDGYVLHLEDEDGDTTEFEASNEQLDEMNEAIDEALSRDEDADALDTGDEADEPEE